MIIAVDFDGTCVEHEFPYIGADAPGAVEWLRKFVAAGAQLILWTMRSDGGARGSATPLTDAVNWFKARNIPLYGVNANPAQHTWTGSPKAFAHVYIDDMAFGCPLIRTVRGELADDRPVVDWDAVGPAVLKMIQRGRGA